ncbi:MAG: hypothetical protein KDI08_03420, partial [Pseudomonadales bacterium]|nr:hypothetical protein [Pseudomonadales bacterium]
MARRSCCWAVRCSVWRAPGSRPSGNCARSSLIESLGTSTGFSTPIGQVLEFSADLQEVIMSTDILPMNVLAPVGNLNAYLQAVQRIPMLSQEDEQRLARQYSEEGDLDAARQLVLSHLR